MGNTMQEINFSIQYYNQETYSLQWKKRFQKYFEAIYLEGGNALFSEWMKQNYRAYWGRLQQNLERSPQKYDIMIYYLRNAASINHISEKMYKDVRTFADSEITQEQRVFETTTANICTILEKEKQAEQKIYARLKEVSKQHPIISWIIIEILVGILVGMLLDCIIDAIHQMKLESKQQVEVESQGSIEFRLQWREEDGEERNVYIDVDDLVEYLRERQKE